MAEKSKVAKKSLATIRDYKTVFNSVEGKRVLWDLMKIAGMTQTNFVQGDPYGTAYNEGIRQCVLSILNKLKLDTEKLEKEIAQGEKSDRSIFE